jgi:flagellar hook-associated protein 3 FlgL
MKATIGMTYRMLYSELNTITNRMFDLQQQAATGKKLNAPSDDPAAIKPLLNYRVESKTTERYLTHMGFAKDEMDILDSSLDRMENLMVQAKETGIQAMNGAADEADREVLADEIGQIFDELLAAGNTRANGEYTFAGYQDETLPFTENTGYDPENYDAEDASTWPVQYHGDGNRKSVEVAPGERLDTGLAGCELLLGDADNNQEQDADGMNLFAVLKNFEQAIRSNDQGGMDEGLEALEDGANQIRRLRGRMGNNAAQIERATEHLSAASLEIKETISTYEDADVMKVYTDLMQHETTLQAALNVTSKVSKLTILDYM